MDFSNVNPSLMKLAELLKMSIPKPSHGYTISEAGPEIVTAPGVYFPSKPGEVIPLQSRQEGGSVSPTSSSSDTEKEKLSILRDIISVIKPRQGMESRQFGGPVSPDSEPSLMDQIEKTKYDIFKSAMSVLKPQKQQTNTGGGNIPLQPRQQGGSVSPGILEDLLSTMTPGGRGPFAKSGGPYNERTSGYGSPSGPSQFSNSPSFPTTPSLPSLPGLPKPITPSSYGMMPEATKPSEGEALWQKKRAQLGWENPGEDLWEHKRREAGVLDLTSRQYGGSVSPDEEWKRLGKLLDLGISVNPERLEIAKRNQWAQPGYAESQLAKAQKINPLITNPITNRVSGAFGVSPGYERTYWEAHPEQRLIDEEEARMSPLRNAILKSIKDEENRQWREASMFGPTPRELRAGVTHKGTPSQIPELIQGLKGLIPTLVAGGRRGILPTGVTTTKQPTLSPVGQLITERDALPVNDPRRASYDAAIKKATEQVEKTPTELGLVALAREVGPDGKPTSAAIEAKGQLEDLQNRKIELAGAQLDVKSKDIDIQAIADAVGEGQDARIAVKGSMGNPVASKVQSLVLKKYPKFDFNMSDANYKWKQSQINQRTINFVGGSLPRVEALGNQLQALENADIPAINKVMRQISIQTGRPEYTNFESNRNAIVQEINTALSGSATGSDMRIKIELENLQSSRSPQQIIGAINNLREALISRLDVDLSPIYPKEVVQGVKSLEEYKEELYKKYRGKYGNKPQEVTTTSGIKVDPSKIKEGW